MSYLSQTYLTSDSDVLPTVVDYEPPGGVRLNISFRLRADYDTLLARYMAKLHIENINTSTSLGVQPP